MSDERLMEIETRLAYQDQLIAELNDEVTAQQVRIQQLDELCRSLVARIRSLGDALPDVEPGDQRPPHY